MVAWPLSFVFLSVVFLMYVRAVWCVGAFEEVAVVVVGVEVVCCGGPEEA